MSSATPLIELRGVSKTVSSGGRPLTILHPLDLTIASGQFLAVILFEIHLPQADRLGRHLRRLAA